MSTLLDAEPVIVADAEEAPACECLLCDHVASWSALWSCGETILYCTDHLRWAQSSAGIVCVCPGNEGNVITLVTSIPL